MADAKKTVVKKTVVTEPEKVKEELKAAVAEKKAAAPAKKEEPAKKAAPAKKAETAKKTAPAKKEEPVKKAAPAKKEEPAKKAAAPAKKAEVKATIKVELSADRQYTNDDLMKILNDVWKFDMKKKVSDIKTVEMYVKPYENSVWALVNGTEEVNFNI